MAAEQVFLQFSIDKLRQLQGRIDACLKRLREDQVWLRGSRNENAVGNLCLHLAGNVRQWILHGVGAQADTRVRDLEFAAEGGKTKAELQALLSETVAQAAGLLGGLRADDLLRRTQVQKYDLTVLEAIYHVVEHFAQHTGQIVFATKAFTGEDLGFYAHLGRRGPRAPAGKPRQP